MKKKTLIILIILFILIICGATCYISIHEYRKEKMEEMNRISRIHEIREKEKIIPLEEIDKSKIESVNKMSGFYKNDIASKNFIAENAEYIIIGTVTSIDGMTNYNPTIEEYVMARTVGTIKVDKVLKGDLKEDIIPFVRVGGTLPLSEYEKSLPEAHREKVGLNKISQQEKKKRFVTEIMEGDIEIEEGKTYLIYTSYATDYERYSIQFLQYGLREVESSSLNKDTNKRTLDSNEYETIKVKNNENGNYEKLSAVLPSKFKRNM